MGKISEATKIKQKRGQGTGADYNPWIHIQEVSSLGTKEIFNDWKTGRQMHLLSQNEVRWYYILRWNDDVLDIREQFPLELEKTLDLAEAMGVKHPKNRHTHMTTDMLVTFRNNKNDRFYRAYSIKDNVAQIFGDLSNKEVLRQVEIQRIEMAYWKLHGIEFRNVFGDRDIDPIYAGNIRMLISYYDPREVVDERSMVKYMCAHKQIDVNLRHGALNLEQFAEEYLADPENVEDVQQKMYDLQTGRAVPVHFHREG
jgi:hypothetical protein